MTDEAPHVLSPTCSWKPDSSLGVCRSTCHQMCLPLELLTLLHWKHQAECGLSSLAWSGWEPGTEEEICWAEM